MTVTRATLARAIPRNAACHPTRGDQIHPIHAALKKNIFIIITYLSLHASRVRPNLCQETTYPCLEKEAGIGLGKGIISASL